MTERVAAPAERVLDLFHGVRLTPTQRRIAHCLVQHAAGRGVPVGGRGGRAGRGQPAVGDPVRDGARLRRLPGAAPPAARADRRPRPAARRTPATSSSGRYAAEIGNLRPARRTARRPRTAIAEAGAAARRQPAAAGARPAGRRAAGRVLRATSPRRCTRTCGCSTTAAACSPTGWSRPRAAGATARAGLRAAPLPAGDAGRAARGPRRRADRRGDHRLAGQPGRRARRRGAARRGRHRSSSSTCTPPRWPWPWCCCRRSATPTPADTQRRLEAFEPSAARRQLFLG